MAEQTAQTRGLEVHEDRRWQEKFWVAQRFGWAIMALLLLGAILGATGKGGVLASASERTSAGVIEYPRITRWQSDEQVTVRLPPSAGGQVEVAFSRDFLDLFSLDSVQPEPSEVGATGEGHVFTFNVEPGGEKTILFNVTSGKPVLNRRMRARIGEARPVELRLTVLP